MSRWDAWPAGAVSRGSVGGWHIIERDLASGTSTLVSVLPNATTGVGLSYDPVFSPDGNSILFISGSSDLVDYSGGFKDELFIKNLQTGSITLVSAAKDGTPGDKSLYAVGDLRDIE